MMEYIALVTVQSPVTISLLVVLACCIILLIMKRNPGQFPQPKGLPIFGNMHQLDLFRYVDTFRSWHKSQGDTFLATFLHLNYVDSVEPKVIEAVIHGPGRDDLYRYSLIDVMGSRSIIMADGILWKSHRKLLNPLFSAHSLSQLLANDPSFVDVPAKHLIRRLSGVADTGKPFLMDYELARVSLAIIGRAIFHYDFGYMDLQVDDPDTPILEALWAGMDEYNKRMSDPLRKWINPKSIYIFRKIMGVLNNLVKEKIRDRRACNNLDAQGKKYEDSLGVLMEALRKGKTPEGLMMKEQDVTDNIITLLLAGHETTAHTLSFALYRVAQNPEVEAKLIATLDAFGRDREMTYDDLNTGELAYVGQVINEALRVNPVAPSIIRKIPKGHAIGDVIANQDYNVGVTLPFLHMDERLWPNPEKFDPERFDPAQEAKRPVTSYLPFGGGQRTCLGKKLALLELKYLLAYLYRNFTFELVPGFKYDVVIKVTMHEVHSMPLLIKRRKFNTPAVQSQ